MELEKINLRKFAHMHMFFVVHCDCCRHTTNRFMASFNCVRKVHFERTSLWLRASNFEIPGVHEDEIEILH